MTGSTRSGWSGVSILCLGESASFMCSFYRIMHNCLSRSGPMVSFAVDRLGVLGGLPLLHFHRLIGLVVGRPPPERKIPGSNAACAGIFSGSSHTSDLKMGSPVATLPGAWRIGSALGLVSPVSVYCDWVR